MPIEIMELVVRATVNTSQQSQGNAASSSAQSNAVTASNTAVESLQKTVDALKTIIKDKKER